MIRAVTFDFWQTLYAENDDADHGYVRWRAQRIAEYLQNHGCCFDDQAVMVGLEDARTYLDGVWKQERRTVGAEILADILLRRLGVTSVDGIPGEIASILQTAVLHLPLSRVPHAIETLRLLSSQFPVALICDTGFTPGRVLREMMRRDGVLNCFRHLTFSDEVGCSKPSPKNFACTLEALGVGPHEAVHVGDLIETDIIGAKEAGMKAVLYWGEGRTYEATEPADAVIRDHRELPATIEALCSLRRG